MSKYLIYCESFDGRRGTVTCDEDGDLEEFKNHVKDDGVTSRYAVIELANVEFVELDRPPDIETEMALARAAMDRLRAEHGDDYDPAAVGLPVEEHEGFKIVNASGVELPPGLAESLLEAMIESGQLCYGEDGKLEPGPNAPGDGELVGIDFDRDEDGDVVRARKIDVPQKKNLN